MTKAQFAVMGNPIAHSLSPVIHQQFATQTGLTLSYEKMLIDLECLEQEVRDFFAIGGIGLNITLPFKHRAFLMSDERSARCRVAKSANTLWFSAGKLCADNTDGIGFVRDLQQYINVAGSRVLVLGAGGAVSGILPSLLALNPLNVTIANRTIENAIVLQQNYPNLITCDLHSINGQFDLIIHGTSQRELSLPSSLLNAQPFCYDLNYQKDGLTPFVLWAKSHHCDAVDGYGFLVEQAAEAFYLWHGVFPEVTLTKKMR